MYFGGYKVGKRSLLNIRNFRSVKSVIQESFDNLKTDYIDLFLLHWIHPLDLTLRMYEELTKLYHDGRIHAIGVCSSLPAHFTAYADVSDVVPAVNQFELSPLNTQKQLIKYCQDKGVCVEAMSTFSHFRSNEPRKEVVENPTILKIAENHGKSAVQVVLRWLIQQGIAIIPKTWNHKHLVENISLDDFELSQEEMAMIDSLDQGKYLNYDPTPWVKKMPEKYKNIGF